MYYKYILLSFFLTIRFNIQNTMMAKSILMGKMCLPINKRRAVMYYCVIIPTIFYMLDIVTLLSTHFNCYHIDTFYFKLYTDILILIEIHNF